MERDQLYLGDWQFPVAKEGAALHGMISNATDFKLFWMIEIACVESVVVIEGESYFWRPRVYHESMQFSIRDWKGLEGKHCYANADDDDPAAIYLYAHQDIDNCDIHFVSRHDKAFDVTWTFNWSEYKGQVQTSVDFTEITVWIDEIDDVAKAKERLGQDLDLSFFTEPETVTHPQIGPSFKFRPL